MKKLLTPEKLRSLSKKGRSHLKKQKAKESIIAKEELHAARLREAQEQIKEAESKMVAAAKGGKREVQVCCVDEKDKIIRETVQKHFTAKGFKVVSRRGYDTYAVNDEPFYEIFVVW